MWKTNYCTFETWARNHTTQTNRITNSYIKLCNNFIDLWNHSPKKEIINVKNNIGNYIKNYLKNKNTIFSNGNNLNANWKPSQMGAMIGKRN